MKRLIFRWLAALCAAAVLCTLVGCSVFRSPADDTTLPETEPPVTKPVTPPATEPLATETEPTDEPTVPGVYDAVIGAYTAAYEAGFDEYQFASADLSEMCVLGGGAEVVGYALADLNGDGTDELIVGRRADIYDLYTTDAEGVIVHLLTASDRTTFRIGTDGIIMQYDEETSLESVRTYSRVENGELVFVRRIACTYDEDDNPIWTLSEGDAQEERIISIPDANAIMDAFESVSYPLTLFAILIEP